MHCDEEPLKRLLQITRKKKKRKLIVKFYPDAIEWQESLSSFTQMLSYDRAPLSGLWKKINQYMYRKIPSQGMEKTSISRFSINFL